jgi:hypothetical protein
VGDELPNIAMPNAIPQPPAGQASAAAATNLAPSLDYTQRWQLLGRISQEEMAMAAARSRLSKLEAISPHLALPSRALDNHDHTMDDAVSMGSGSFAHVWATCKVFAPEAAGFPLSQPQTYSWCGQPADETKPQTEQGGARFLVRYIYSALSNTRRFSNKHPARALNYDVTTTGRIQYQTALKVLQLPLGTRGQRLWLPRPAQASMPHRTVKELWNAYDELRWQKLFCKEAEALVRLAWPPHERSIEILKNCMHVSNK